MAALTLEQKLELGASDLRFLLTNYGIQDANQGALFEAGVDTMAKFAAFVTTVLVPHWDAKGHLSVKKGSSSVAISTGPEQLRLRLTVMYNALAMIKLKHPGRNELTDFNADLIEKYKDYLLGDYVCGLRSAEAAGSMIPPWTLVSR